MIKAKTSIKLLRRLGIVLIALPEPITTPFGVAFGLTAHYLSRRLEASMNKRFRETLKHYLAHRKRLSDEADGESGAPGRVKGSTQSQKHLIPWQYKGSRSVEVNPGSLTRQSRRDTRDDIVVHHTVDRESLARRYSMVDGSKVKPGVAHWEITSGRTEKLIHHSIDRQMPSRCYQADGSFEVESSWSGISSSAAAVVHHTINMESLSRRYKGEESTGSDASRAGISATVEGVAHRSVNIKLLSQRCETDGAAPVEVKYHTVNMAALLRRYRSAVL